MQNMAISTLDMPEILAMVAAYLDGHTLHACILVCRSLHSSFTPFLWRHIICRGAPPHTVQTLRRHSPLVEVLAFHQYIPTGYSYLKFRRLRTLRLVELSNSVSKSTTAACIDLPLSLAVLAKGHRHTKHLDASYVHTELSARFWSIVETLWENPISLSVRSAGRDQIPTSQPSVWDGSEVADEGAGEGESESKDKDKDKDKDKEKDKDKKGQEKKGKAQPPKIPTPPPPPPRHEDTDEELADAFWKACTRFEELSLDVPTMTIERLSKCPQLPSFPNLKRLTVSKGRWMSTSDKQEMALLRACGNLQSLCWKRSSSRCEPSLTTFPARAFREDLQSQTWPHLTTLSLKHVWIQDDLLASILQLLPKPLYEFRLEESGQFGAESFANLSNKHFATLEKLSVVGCRDFTSEMVQGVLTQCRRLKSLAADYVRMDDIVGRDGEEGQPWVCVQLEELKVFFVAPEVMSAAKEGEEEEEEQDKDITEEEAAEERVEWEESLKWSSSETKMVMAIATMESGAAAWEAQQNRKAQQDRKAQQQKIFKRLGALTELKVLDLSMYMYILSGHPKDVCTAAREGRSLNLRLGLCGAVDDGGQFGAGKVEAPLLAGLEKLQCLIMDRTTQELNMEDTMWMARHWWRLSVVSGRLSQNRTLHSFLANVLAARSIHCPP